MSNELLLRLFTSEFFNCWIAVSYLFRYSNNVGIQHYLCAELRNVPLSEIEFFLPQLIHLLITRPSESVALEHFIAEMCETSTHMALMTLWYLQAYVSDLSANPSTPSFQLCKRLLNRSQAILFADDDDDSREEHEEGRRVHFFNESNNALNDYNKVRENVFPTLVGIGTMLLGVGQPILSKPAGRIAIAQGRRRRDLLMPGEQQHNRKGTTSYSQPDLPIKRQSLQPSAATSTNSLILPDNAALKSQHAFTSSPSLEDLHRGRAFSVKKYIQKLNHGASTTSSASSKNEQRYLKSKNGAGIDKKTRKESLNVYDPALTALGQSSVPTNNSPSFMSPALSYVSTSSSVSSLSSAHSDSASISLSRRSSSSSSFNQSHTHQEVPMENQSSSGHVDKESHQLGRQKSHTESLLRSSYFRSEIQFVLALVDIATRLVIVPKEARMSALQAELTLLNHNLPAEICLPLWCPCTSNINKSAKSTAHHHNRGHHRIVRISPSDAVVLNSAERAPYLLMIEVLEDDEEGAMTNGYNSALYKAQQERHAAMNSKNKSSCAKQKNLQNEKNPMDSTSAQQQGPNSTTMYDSSATVSTNRPYIHSDQPRDEFAERMRTAAVMLAQLPSDKKHDPIRQKIIKEMMAFEQQRLDKMKFDGVGSVIANNSSSRSASLEMSDTADEQQHQQQQQKQDDAVVTWAVNKDDPSAAVLSEKWESKKERLRSASPYGHLSNWRLISVIVKNGADLRQEQFAIQLIREMQRIWEDTGVDVWVKYYRVLVTSDSSGLIETLRNTISIHSIKKEAYRNGWHLQQKGAVYSLFDYFERQWGPPDSDDFLKAQDAFMRSLAGYSIACYLLQIKDRHNGNLLIDDAGHLIHIDFGFMLSNSPGSVGFEMAPFKLPQEYIDILGGVHGEKFAEYKALMKAAFLAVRKHSENILLLTEMMCKDSKLPCFLNGDLTVPQLRDRFQLHLTEPQVEEFVDKLIMSSCCNVFTRLYDTFQYYSQGIL